MAVGSRSGSDDQAAAVLGVLGEVPERRADGAPRRVDAGEQQQHDRAADVLGRQLLVAELDLQQVRRQVVAGVGAVVLDLARRCRRRAGGSLGPHLGIAVDALQRVVDELAEQVVVLDREAEHAGDHVDRDVGGVLGGGVDDGLARRDVAEVVEALLAQQPDLGLPRLDLLGANGGSSRRRASCVERRIAGDRRGRHRSAPGTMIVVD